MIRLRVWIRRRHRERNAGAGRGRGVRQAVLVQRDALNDDDRIGGAPLRDEVLGVRHPVGARRAVVGELREDDERPHRAKERRLGYRKAAVPYEQAAVVVVDRAVLRGDLKMERLRRIDGGRDLGGRDTPIQTNGGERRLLDVDVLRQRGRRERVDLEILRDRDDGVVVGVRLLARVRLRRCDLIGSVVDGRVGRRVDALQPGVRTRERIGETDGDLDVARDEAVVRRRRAWRCRKRVGRNDARRRIRDAGDADADGGEDRVVVGVLVLLRRAARGRIGRERVDDVDRAPRDVAEERQLADVDVGAKIAVVVVERLDDVLPRIERRDGERRARRDRSRVSVVARAVEGRPWGARRVVKERVPLDDLKVHGRRREAGGRRRVRRREDQQDQVADDVTVLRAGLGPLVVDRALDDAAHGSEAVVDARVVDGRCSGAALRGGQQFNGQNMLYIIRHRQQTPKPSVPSQELAPGSPDTA